MSQSQCSVRISNPIVQFMVDADDIRGLSQKGGLSQVMPLFMGESIFLLSILNLYVAG